MKTLKKLKQVTSMNVLIKNSSRNQYKKMHILAENQSRISSVCNKEPLKGVLKMLYSMDKADCNTYLSLLTTCINMKALREGKRVHLHLIRTGFEVDIHVGNKLVIMYGKCGRFEDARHVFDEIPERDVVTWSAMIGGYSQNGQDEDAVRLFRDMMVFGVKPNQFTFGSVVNACAKLEALEEGKQVHGYVVKIGFESNSVVGSVLVDMYAKCGSIEDAHKVFDELPDRTVVASTAMVTGYVRNERVDKASELFWRMTERNVVSWNAMIAGYAQNGHNEEAVKLFVQMRCWGNSPNQSTFSAVLSACGNLAALEKGRHIHGLIIKTLFKLGVFVGNALTTMYAKCGVIEDARRVFDRVTEQNVVTWNALIAGYAQHGEGEETLNLFEQMQKVGMKPNHVTFLCVLSACSHAGLVCEGQHYFYSMCQDYGLVPRVEHYACVVDLLGRSGYLVEAEEFIEKMPLKPNAGLWKALLAACRIHANSELGQRAAEKIFELGEQHPSTYVILSNIYAEAGRWNDVAKVRVLMKDRGVKKAPAFSWIEVKNQVHSFVIGDRSHPQTEEIYAMVEKLTKLMKEAGYKPNPNFALHEVD
ncbi:pentatricopeptide repeat-containing protein At2g13600 [Cryptomeria japonica]|uniref:pentatricopeptide repeat-containing protein At2g13600 n=1 Tax=Cryptomeria japonica TaxID=3369 RepID=UPI0025ABAC09|nr:pentatricopeptide repeat-containing protein At2g13600 [Cryptomeria japonica]XP_057865523.1 pentatricopeptide repeat-containing protein At2g13600 [Cryptomeria japonica]XP_057865524.1 pentatricopeptide repeat-containing protein At2g13600 [Cryptomeria japonica]